MLLTPGERQLSQLFSRWNHERRKIVAPTLFHFEVANTLYQYQRLDILSSETVQSAHELALSLDIELLSGPWLHRQAIRLADQYGLPTTYDAHYLALAERLGTEFWTIDKRLYRKVAHLHYVHTLTVDK